MPKASVKRLIECKKEDLINLVLDIEKYPEFVPFCYAAKIYKTSEKDNQIKIIADRYADPEQGSGAVKITPAHDFNDYEVGKRNKLEIINIFEKNEPCLLQPVWQGQTPQMD